MDQALLEFRLALAYKLLNRVLRRIEKLESQIEKEENHEKA